jgi:GNAT superfamily N-acetyltransferase
MLVRPATPADYDAFSRLFPELAVDDPVPDRTKFEVGMMATTLFAEESGQIRGYVFFQILRKTAYVRNIVTAPEARQRGVGRELMTAVAGAARAAGCSAWALNVKPDNEAALALYTGLGLRVTGRAWPLKLPWSAASGVSPVALREVPPEEDDAVERLTEQEEGLFQAQRARGRRILGFDDGSPARWGGVVVFDPGFPGAFPFWVARPEDALPFVAALRPLAPSSDRVMIAVERHEAIANVLTAAGATLRFLIDQMKGPLP